MPVDPARPGALSSYKEGMPGNDQLVCALKTALAGEVRVVRSLMEQLAEVLVSNEQLALGYTEQLQSFDLAIQLAEEMAALLERLARGSPPLEAVGEVRLSAVQDRLYAALKAR